MNNSIAITPELIATLNSDVLTSLEIARNASLYILKNESLTVRGFSKAHTTISSLNSCIRTMIFFNDLVSYGSSERKLKMTYCNIDTFFTSIVDALNNIFAGGYEIQFKYISKLDSKRTFYINTINTEKILYALIYCLVKNLKENDKKEIKLIFDENYLKSKSYFVTITAGGKPIPPELSGIFSEDTDVPPTVLDVDIAGLHAAQKNAKTLGGSISYEKTKTLNKFIFRFPHVNEFEVSNEGAKLLELSTFEPDLDLLSVFFTELSKKYFRGEKNNAELK